MFFRRLCRSPTQPLKRQGGQFRFLQGPSSRHGDTGYSPWHQEKEERERWGRSSPLLPTPSRKGLHTQLRHQEGWKRRRSAGRCGTTGERGSRYPHFPSSEKLNPPPVRPPDYTEDLDPETGESAVQQRFDQLVFRALLRFGPALPVEVLERAATHPGRPCPVVLACDDAYTDLEMQRKQWGHCETKTEERSHSLGCRPEEERVRGRRDAERSGLCPSTGGSRGDDQGFVFLDEVRVKPHELLRLIQMERPGFSIRRDGGGVPFSLLIRNCPYLRSFGGYATYMRQVRKEPGVPRHGGCGTTAEGNGGRGKAQRRAAQREGDLDEQSYRASSYNDTFEKNKRNGNEGNEEGYILFSLGKYKFREIGPQDGIRCGPQPWLYSAKLL
eukprot:gene1474-863_t